MKKNFFFIGISLILSVLPACTRSLEAVPESQSTPPKPALPQSESSPSKSEPPLSSRKPLNTELFVWGHKSPTNDPWEYQPTYQYTSWTPNGEYFVGFYDYGVDVYNTRNEVENQFYLPENVSLCGEDGKSLEWDIFVCDSGFYLLPNHRYQNRYGYSLFWQSGEEILISDLLFIDWEGNVLIQNPSVSFYEDQGEDFFYGETVYQIRRSPDFYMVDEDFFLLSVYIDSNTSKDNWYSYIPSKDKLDFIGEFGSIYDPVKTSQGIIWSDLSDIWLSTPEGSRILFDSKDFRYLYPPKPSSADGSYRESLSFASSNDLLALSVDLDVYGQVGFPRNKVGVKHPFYLFYASLNDMQLKEIGEMSSSLYPSSLRICGQYVVYYDYEGCHIFDTETGEHWLREIDSSNQSICQTAYIEGVRMKDGKPEVILYFMNGNPFVQDSPGCLVVTKEKTVFYPFDQALSQKSNPTYTHFVDINDKETFSIKPFLDGSEEGIVIEP